MDIQLRFLGAARNVTGSKTLIEFAGQRLLVDCGLVQEWKLKSRNWSQLAVPPESIDAVILTHAHLDHCGWLPKLIADGFRGKVYCTRATAGLARIILLDSAHLQEEEVKQKQKRHAREQRTKTHPIAPLYTTAEAETALEHLLPTRYGQRTQISDSVEVCFYDAGHILGSSMVEFKLSQNGETRTLVFSGDVGRRDKPILRDPSTFEHADYVIVESTYGDRQHKEEGDLDALLAEVINDTYQKGGNIIIPAFSIGRSQELMYRLNNLLRDKKIPRLAVFVDSPMAIKATYVFQRYADLFDEEATELMNKNTSPFDFENLHMTSTSAQSKAINNIRGTVIIMAGSGMCTGGRVKHHLVHNISRPESTILFVGYQADGTLGGSIVRGAETIRILGAEYRIRARIAQIHGFSAHADRDELVSWLQALKTPPRHVFVNHGEESAALSFGDHLREKTGWQVSVPEFNSTVELD